MGNRNPNLGLPAWAVTSLHTELSPHPSRKEFLKGQALPAGAAELHLIVSRLSFKAPLISPYPPFPALPTQKEPQCSSNEDAPASAVKSVSHLHGQVDIYRQSVGCRRKGERLPVQKAVTLVWMQCHQPKPSLLQMYSILFKGKQISATECHGKDTSPALN